MSFASDDDRERIFRSVFDRYYRPISRFFRKHGCRPDHCSDLTQETFYRAYRGFSSLQKVESIEGWLFSIAQNIWRNSLRNANTEKRLGHEVPLEHEQKEVERANFSKRVTPEDRAIEIERLRLVSQAIEDLPPRMRHCVLLRAAQGLEYEKIASTLSMSTGTVKAHLRDARARLRVRLSELYPEA